MHTDTLEKFGTEFQTKTVRLLMKNKDFLQQIYDVVNPEFFDSKSKQWIVRTIIEYYKQYRDLPTALVFRSEVDAIKDDLLKVAVSADIKNLQSPVGSDSKYVKEKFVQFCRNQTIKNALFETATLLEHEQYDDIIDLMRNALRSGTERDYGHMWKEDIDDRLNGPARTTISTPWECLNKHMDGGLGESELGVIMAPSGAGKSWVLIALGAEAMRQGLNVVHITLELKQRYTGRRYDTIFSGIAPQELSKHDDLVRKKIAQVPGNIVIKYFPAKLLNPERVMTHVQQLEGINYIADLLIVDYPDLMVSNRSEANRYQELGTIYEELRSVAGELNIPCWVASQTQRSSIEEETIGANKVADSYRKIMGADFVMSLSRTTEDKLVNTGRIHIVKNRFGPEAINFPAKIDITNGIFEIYDEHSIQGLGQIRVMESADKLVKQMLSQKHEEFLEEKKRNSK